MTLGGLRRHLARLDLALAAEAALAAQAEVVLAAAHETGTAGGEVRADRTDALVGWRSPALRRRESGDVGVPPAPVLATVAMELGAPAAMAVGAAVADALRGA